MESKPGLIGLFQMLLDDLLGRGFWVELSPQHGRENVIHRTVARQRLIHIRSQPARNGFEDFVAQAVSRAPHELVGLRTWRWRWQASHTLSTP